MSFSSQVALVQWTESVGLTLVGRDQSSVQLRSPGGHILNFTILQIFPFTYESKRMGIIVRVRAACARWDSHSWGSPRGTRGSPGPASLLRGGPRAHRRAPRRGWGISSQRDPLPPWAAHKAKHLEDFGI